MYYYYYGLSFSVGVKEDKREDKVQSSGNYIKLLHKWLSRKDGWILKIKQFNILMDHFGTRKLQQLPGQDKGSGGLHVLTTRGGRAPKLNTPVH